MQKFDNMQKRLFLILLIFTVVCIGVIVALLIRPRFPILQVQTEVAPYPVVTVTETTSESQSSSTVRPLMTISPASSATVSLQFAPEAREGEKCGTDGASIVNCANGAQCDITGFMMTGGGYWGVCRGQCDGGAHCQPNITPGL